MIHAEMCRVASHVVQWWCSLLVPGGLLTLDVSIYIPHEADLAQDVLGVDDVLGHRVDLLDSHPFPLWVKHKTAVQLVLYDAVLCEISISDVVVRQLVLETY